MMYQKGAFCRRISEKQCADRRKWKMNVTSVEKKEKSTVELVIEVGAEEFEAAIQKVYLKNRSKLSVPGFRKGKAPRKIIEGMYGSGVFYDDAINDLYPDAYAQAVKEQGLDDVGYPKVELVSAGKEGFTFKALVSVRPEVTLGQYKDLTAPMAEVSVTEQDVDGELEPFIKRATRLAAVERPARMGDTAVIDFEGFDNGTPFEGGKGEHYELVLGSGSFVPGFEDQVIGMAAGEEKNIDITFPEDYVPDLAGKAVVFKVKVTEVKEPLVPELDDEFAKDVSEFETLEEFRKDLEDKLLQRRQAQAKSDFENAILEQLAQNIQADIPDAMVEVRLDRMMDDYAARMANQGITLENYLKMMGMTPEMFRAGARSDALKQVQLELALEAVVKAEDLQATDEEVEAEVKRLAEQYKLSEEQVKAAVPESEMRYDLCMRKANDLVIVSAKVGQPEAKPQEEGTGEPATAEEPEKAEKPKRTRKKKEAPEASEGAGEPEEAEKPKRSSKKTAKQEEE